VVGTSAGGYFAARLALLRPKQVRSVVLVNALVSTSMRAPGDPDAPATPAQRLSRVKSIAPTPQLVPIAPVPPPEELRRLIADPNSMHPTARNWMGFAVKDTAVSRAWTFEALSAGFMVPSLEYGWELTSTDLTGQLKELAVPLLVMGSWHDEGSTATNVPNISQWEEIKLLYPSIPLTIAAFDDTRAYISADAPENFDRALADFLAGRPVQGKAGFSLPRASPRASVMQAVSSAEIQIAYGRPAVKGRKIWGELVPNGRVWRAGANEATKFIFNHAVKIEGSELAAGTYTFFVIPGEAEWTLIFNRVPRQWGAFDYNPAFDALRVTVKPTEGTHEEYLRYTIQPANSNAVVTLAWEKRAASFRIDVSP
jgi:pimeloyl-ACP methyl ester carboxylesterase